LGVVIQSFSRSGMGRCTSVTTEYTCQQACFSFGLGTSTTILTANRSYISSKGTFLFFILFQMDEIDFGLPNMRYGISRESNSTVNGLINSVIYLLCSFADSASFVDISSKASGSVIFMQIS